MPDENVMSRADVIAGVLAEHGADYLVGANRCLCGAAIHDDAQFRLHLTVALDDAINDALDAAEVGAALVALGKRSYDEGDLHEYRHAVAALNAGNSEPCVDGTCHLEAAAEPAAEQARAGALTEAEAFAVTAERITRDRMAHYGYTPEQIAEAEVAPPHTEACEHISMGNYECEDEYGRPNHPDRDELDRTADFVVWVLEHPALTDATETETALGRVHTLADRWARLGGQAMDADTREWLTAASSSLRAALAGDAEHERSGT